MEDFNPSRYATFLGTSTFGSEIWVFPELESTNTWLKTATGVFENGAICLTDRQIKGRGQHHRRWISEPCANLTWSYYLRPDSQDRLFLLTLACIHAVANVLERDFQLSTHIKWPNDLFVGGKKVAGVLAEAVFIGNHLDRFIIGIGLNVNQASFPDDLPHAASLSQLVGHTLDRELLLAHIVVESNQIYQAWRSMDPKLVNDINHRLIGYGSKVNVEVDGVKLEGNRLLLGVNINGYLLLMDDEYTVQTYAYEQVRIYVDPS
jgi:BirA family transcriptional regulator, biotin operon repressor / biotin---[acetyl-CoA-carboxylase] ligase